MQPQPHSAILTIFTDLYHFVPSKVAKSAQTKQDNYTPRKSATEFFQHTENKKCLRILSARKAKEVDTGSTNTKQTLSQTRAQLLPVVEIVVT